MRFTKRRLLLSLTLIAALTFMSVGFTGGGCTKEQKQNFDSYAKDVADALVQSQPLVDQLLTAKGRKDLADKYDKIVPSGAKLVAAIAASNKTDALAIASDIFPVVEEVVGALSGNTTVQVGLALANIGLHFLLNHLPASATASLGPAKAKQIATFRRAPVWGCKYRPDKCK